MSKNFNLLSLRGTIIKSGDSFFLKRTIQDIPTMHKILDSTSRSPLQSKRFFSFENKEVIIEGYFISKILYIRKIKGDNGSNIS